MSAESLTVVDNRTGAEYTLPIVDGAIHATELGQIKDADGAGLLSYDPAFLNTASCRSAITYIDGDAGILRYRGYPIEQVAERAGFLETAYLLFEGELPTDEQLQKWTDDVRMHTYVHTNIEEFMAGFRYDAHPMGMLLGAVGALSTFYPDAKHISDPENRYLQRVRLIAKLPTIAAFIFRHNRGLPYVLPAQRPRLRRQLRQHDLRDRRPARAEPGAAARARDPPHPPRRPRAELLDERRAQRRLVATSTRSRPSPPASRRSTGRCTAAPTRPCCGCSTRSATSRTCRPSSRRVKDGSAGTRLMGFGHRVYKSYDPRAKLIKEVADSVFAETGVDPKLEIALELERIALEDEYFVSRKLYPERRLLLGPDLQGDGLSDGLLHRPLRARPPAGLDRAVGGDAHRPRDQDRAAAAALHRLGRARVRADGGSIRSLSARA